MGLLLAQNDTKGEQMTDYWDVATTRNHLENIQRALSGSLPETDQT
jgi:hypothetical protein